METVVIEILVKIVMVRRLEIPWVLSKTYWPDAWLNAMETELPGTPSELGTRVSMRSKG